MRINELNMFQKMFGKLGFGGGAPDTSGVGSAILRGRKSGLSPEDQLAQDTFVKRFVSRVCAYCCKALVSLSLDKIWGCPKSFKFSGQPKILYYCKQE